MSSIAFRIESFLLMILVSSACVSVDVKTEAASATDFRSYASYAYAQPVSASDPSPQPEWPPDMWNRVRGEIDTSLAEKGYRRADEDAADLLVTFSIATQSTLRLVNAADPDTDFEVPREFKEGTLTVTISDRRAGQQIWRGVGETKTATSGALWKDDPERAVIESARKVLAEFPSRGASDS